VGLGKVCQPIRAAVSGTNVTPGLFEVLELLGRDETLKRMRRALGSS
jgi:glutamyl-tRNA synthetase